MNASILMYHFITGGDKLSFFRGLKGVPIDQFQKQLQSLCSHMEPLTLRDILNAVESNQNLPERSFYLTFDEGTRDQFEKVFPILEEMELEAAFFVCTRPLVEGKVSVVEKQRHLQYVAYKDYSSFLQIFCEKIVQFVPNVNLLQVKPTRENIDAAIDYLTQYVFYSLEERFYRKIRNEVLTIQQFESLIHGMFSEIFPDEKVFIKEFYMSFNDLRDLHKAGMIIGGHSHSHPFLSKLSKKEQHREILKNISILRQELGTEITAFAYPYGDFNNNTIEVIKGSGISHAFTTQDRPVGEQDDWFVLPRIDAASFDRFFI